LVGLVAEKDETKLTQLGAQFVKKYENFFHILEDDYDLGAPSAELFGKGVQG